MESRDASKPFESATPEQAPASPAPPGTEPLRPEDQAHLQIALETQRRKGEEAVNRSNQSLKVLAGTASQLLHSEAPQEAVQAACTEIMRHLDCHVFFNFLAVPEQGRLRLNAAAGVEPELLQRIEWLDYGEAACGSVAQSRQRVVLEDIQTRADSRTNIIRPLGIQAYACHPLIFRDRLLGTLSFGSRSRTAFSEEDLALMQTVADQLAVALERLHVQQALQATNRRLTEDMAARRHSEEELRGSEQRFRSLVEATAAIVWTTGAGGTFETDQVEWSAYTGQTSEQLRGWGWLDAVHPDDRAHTRAAWLHAVEHQVLYQVERRLRRHDGVYRHMLVRAVPISDSDGQIREWIGADTDIHELKQAQEAVLESERRFRGTFENAAVGITHLHPAGRWLQVNQHFCDMLGYSREELLARTFQEVTHPDDVAGDVEGFGRLMRGEFDHYTLEKRYIRRDGQVIWTSITRALQRDAQGRVLYAISIVQDISKRKAVERELRTFKHLVEWSHDPFYVISPAAGFRLVYVNAAACRHYGRSCGELLQTSIPDWNPDFTPEVCQRFWQELKAKGSMLFETSHLHADGHLIPVEVSANYFEYEGQELFAGYYRDITERKQAEQQLKELNATLEQRVAERTAEAERRAAQLRELAAELTRAEQRERRRLATVLHDHLQQLLVGAKFGTSILHSQTHEEPVRQGLQHVDDLLDQSLQASRSLTVELSPPILYETNLVPVLHWLARWMHEKHRLQVQIEADEDASPIDEEVRILLFQSVRELLFNVVKHAGVSAATVQMRRQDEDHVRIVVSDYGAGFDPSGKDSQDRSGSGFGLFSVRERLEAVGGELEIDSTPGEGTRMTLIAPLRLPVERAREAMTLPPPAAAAPHPAEPPAFVQATSRIRVLLADDHAVVRDGLARLLQTQPDVEVVGQAADGQQAVDLAASLQPDVVLMDVSMPRLNGIEATRRLHADMPEVHVIGLSMHAEEEMAHRMREAGAKGYLTKTSPPEEVIAAIRAGCRRRAG